MAAEVLEPAELFSIVVLGAMNPRIHHPLWYQFAGILSKDEADKALNDKLFVAPDWSSFTTGELRIVCTPDRWEVTTPAEGVRTRLPLLTAKVFDEKLVETPTRLIGTNNWFRRAVNVGDVGSALAKRVVGRGLGLDGLQAHRADVRVDLTGRDGGAVIVQVGASQLPGHLDVRVNANHPVSSVGDETKHFKVGDYLEDHFERDHEDAKRYADDFAASFERMKED